MRAAVGRARTVSAMSYTLGRSRVNLHMLWLAGLAAALSVVLWAPTARGQGVVIPLPPSDQQALIKYLGPGVVGTALPSDPIADATTYFPLADQTFVFQVTSGSNSGAMQILVLTHFHRPAGSPAWRYQLTLSLAAFISSSSCGDL